MEQLKQFQIGPYKICPHPTPSGGVFIEIMKIEDVDVHEVIGNYANPN